MRVVLGIDLGGTNLRLGLVDSRGTVLTERRLTHRDGLSPLGLRDRLLADYAAMSAEATAEAGAEIELVALGVGAPGPLERPAGRIQGAVNLSAWRDVPLTALLEEAFEVPVELLNDGTAFVLGETWRGAAAGCDDVLGLTLGTGVGGGALQDGRPLFGAHGNALELGHLIVDPDGPVCACGRRGCLEAFSSAGALRRRATELARSGELAGLLAAAGGEAKNINCRLLADFAEAGDEVCRRLFHRAGHWLGVGIGRALTLIDADLVVIGGGLAAAGELFLPATREVLTGALFPPRSRLRLVQAELGWRAAVIGSAAAAWGVFTTDS